MKTRPSIQLDGRKPEQILRELLARRLGFVPEWQVSEPSADSALAQIFSRFLYAVVQRLNQAPDKNKLAFLDLLGIDLAPASQARAPIVFQLSADSANSQAPRGVQAAAPPPPGSSQQIVFETETAVGLAAAKLTQVVSLWPGRDQFLDHSADLLAGKSVQLFRKPLLENTPHELYLAHDILLAIAGTATLEVEFELTQPSSESLALLWQYWDGEVWRSFKSAIPACSEKEAANADSTNGLTRSGRYRLETDCSKSAKRKVNGIDGFWIRAVLTEVLLPDPGLALPLVDSVRLASVITNPLKGILGGLIRANDPFRSGQSQIHGVLSNSAGEPLVDVAVKITSPDDDNFEQITVFTTKADPANNIDPGVYNSTQSGTAIASEENYEIQVSFLNLQGTYELKSLSFDRDVELDLTFDVEGLDPDKAFADGTKLDVTKPFFPFGQQPQPGSTFYFSSEEIFTKPGAKVQVYVARTATPQDKLSISPSPQDLDHLIDWEYWSGERWVILFQSSSTRLPAADLNTTEILEFTVPDNIERTKVNDQDGLWMRARLVRGGFGFTQTVTFQGNPGNNTFTYVLSKPPSVASFKIGYTWTYGKFHPEHAITHNDFQYEDHTYEATWPGVTFLPFNRIPDVTPALYLGFDKKLPVDDIGLYFDITEVRGDTLGPALVWEYFDGGTWKALSAEDETRNLRLPGIVSFIAADDSEPYARFGAELHWVRGRLKEDGPPGEPTVNGIFPNAVWAAQQRSFNDTPLGASNGLPNQILFLTQTPVLAGERIEVRELAGPRANVEWRLIARSVAPDNPNTVRDFEELLGGENTGTDISIGDVRLVRDRNKKVAEVWVRWYEVPHFFYSDKDDRHYVIDRARGLVFFGDGFEGGIPPPGSQVIAKQSKAGGGLAGNVAARSISQLLGPLSGVQSVVNPTPAEGGADGETLENFSVRGPQTIKHRGRAVMPSDYETMAHEASAAVAVARAIATRNAAGKKLASWVTLIVIPESKEQLPWPSFGLREEIRKYIEAREPANLAASHHLYVTGPDYLQVGVEATIAPNDPTEAGTVEKQARAALETFLHPLKGGPDRKGWDLGRDVYLSDVAGVLERVDGVDYVEELSLLLNNVPQGESLRVPEGRIVAAGDIRLKLKSAEV